MHREKLLFCPRVGCPQPEKGFSREKVSAAPSTKRMAARQPPVLRKVHGSGEGGGALPGCAARHAARNAPHVKGPGTWDGLRC